MAGTSPSDSILSHSPCSNWVGKLNYWLAHIAGLFCVLLMLLMVFLVIAGKVASFAHEGLEELKWHLFGAMFLFGMGYCLHRNGHVRVDLISSRLPRRLQLGMESFTFLILTLPALLIVIIYGVDMTWVAWRDNHISENVQGLPHRWLIKACIPLGFTFLALQVFARGIDAGIQCYRPSQAEADA